MNLDSQVATPTLVTAEDHPPSPDASPEPPATPPPLTSGALAEPQGSHVLERLVSESWQRAPGRRSRRPRPSPRSSLEIAIAFDLKDDVRANLAPGAPDDALEEYDSLETVHEIAAALAELGHRPRIVGGGRALVQQMLESPPDLVFNIAEGWGTRSREAHVPSLLEMLHVPFTHSDPLTLALSLDKALAKRVVASHGLATPRFAVVSSPAQLERLELGWPVVAKPVAEGSSMGIRDGAIFDSVAALRAALPALKRGYRQAILLEEFCPGPEFTVGVLGTGSAARVLGVMEIVPKNLSLERFLYSLDAKRSWQQRVEYHAPPKRSPRLIRELGKLAVESHRALGCRDVSRVDLRLGRDGRPNFLELNPLPGLSSKSGDLVILARSHGVSHAELVRMIVAEARARLGI